MKVVSMAKNSEIQWRNEKEKMKKLKINKNQEESEKAERKEISERGNEQMKTLIELIRTELRMTEEEKKRRENEPMKNKQISSQNNKFTYR